MLGISLFAFCNETPPQQASRQLDFGFVLNKSFFWIALGSSWVCTSHTLKSYFINQVYWINLNQDWLLLMLQYWAVLRREGRNRVFRNKCILFPFSCCLGSKTSLPHFLQVSRKVFSGQMLLLMATSWHYWCIAVGRRCDKNVGRQHMEELGWLLVLTSQPPPALRLVGYTDLQLSQRRLKPAACLPQEKRWQVLFSLATTLPQRNLLWLQMPHRVLVTTDVT